MRTYERDLGTLNQHRKLQKTMQGQTKILWIEGNYLRE